MNEIFFYEISYANGMIDRKYHEYEILSVFISRDLYVQVFSSFQSDIHASREPLAKESYVC